MSQVLLLFVTNIFFLLVRSEIVWKVVIYWGIEITAYISKKKVGRKLSLNQNLCESPYFLRFHTTKSREAVEGFSEDPPKFKMAYFFISNVHRTKSKWSRSTTKGNLSKKNAAPDTSFIFNSHHPTSPRMASYCALNCLIFNQKSSAIYSLKKEPLDGWADATEGTWRSLYYHQQKFPPTIAYGKQFPLTFARCWLRHRFQYWQMLISNSESIFPWRDPSNCAGAANRMIIFDSCNVRSFRYEFCRSRSSWKVERNLLFLIPEWWDL